MRNERAAWFLRDGRLVANPVSRDFSGDPLAFDAA